MREGWNAPRLNPETLILLSETKLQNLHVYAHPGGTHMYYTFIISFTEVSSVMGNSLLFLIHGRAGFLVSGNPSNRWRHHWLATLTTSWTSQRILCCGYNLTEPPDPPLRSDPWRAPHHLELPPGVSGSTTCRLYKSQTTHCQKAWRSNPLP